MVAEFPRKRGKAQRKPRRTSGQEERFLATEEAIKALGAGIVHQKRRELAKRKKVLAGACRRRLDGQHVGRRRDSSRRRTTTRAFTPSTEPPATAMKTCRGCRRETPPQCVGSSGHCDDCRSGAHGACPMTAATITSSSRNAAELAFWTRARPCGSGDS
jgi:hypothetical protein